MSTINVRDKALKYDVFSHVIKVNSSFLGRFPTDFKNVDVLPTVLRMFFRG